MEKDTLLKQFKPYKDNLLNILHALQNNNPNNYLSQDDLKDAATYLNITYSHVYGVASYYTMFSLKPRGKNIIRVCNSPVCNIGNTTDVINKIKKILSIDIGETSSDKLFTLELTECLGQCDSSPSMMINEDVFGDLNRANFQLIFDNYK